MLRAILCILTSVIVTASAAAAPTVWQPAAGGNGHAYDVIAGPGGISWDNASAAATAAGGHLATLTSSAENDFVFTLTDSNAYWYNFDAGNSIGPWLGGFQPDGSPEPAGGWRWVTAEPFTFNRWSPGQPDNFSGEDRLHYHLTGVGRGPTWNDLQNNGGVLPISYVVEYVPEPGAALCVVAAAVTLFARPRAAPSVRNHQGAASAARNLAF